MDGYAHLVGYLTEGPRARWGCIYFDGKDVVLADSAWPETAGLIRRAAAGQLIYPSQATALLSRAMALTAAVVQSSPREILDAFVASAAANPNTTAYDVIRQVGRLRPDGREWLKNYFQREYARLETMDPHQADGARILVMRQQLAHYLSVLCRDEGSRAEEARWLQAKDQAYAAW
jgi:hypothetical protein